MFPFPKRHPNAGRRPREEILLLSPNLLNPGGMQLFDHVTNGSTNPATNPSASVNF
jgi:hypothetical protein